MPPCKDGGAAPEIPWLKWRVDGLWRSIARLEERFESLAVAVGNDGYNEDKLVCLSDRLKHLENLHACINPSGLCLKELDMRLEQHKTAIEGVCSRIYVERVQDQLKEFFDTHVSRLDDFCAQVRAETLKEAVFLHEKIQLELGRKSTKECKIMLNFDSIDSTMVEEMASREEHRHEEAPAEVVPAIEPSTYGAATLHLHVHPGSCKTVLRSSSADATMAVSSIEHSCESSSAALAPPSVACCDTHPVRNDATKKISDIRRSTGASLALSPHLLARSPRLSHRTIDTVKNDAAKIVSGITRHNTEPVRRAAARSYNSLPVGIRSLDSCNELCGTKVNTVDNVSSQDSNTTLTWGLSDAGSFGETFVGGTVTHTRLPSPRHRAPLLMSGSGFHAGLWSHQAMSGSLKARRCGGSAIFP